MVAPDGIHVCFAIFRCPRDGIGSSATEQALMLWQNACDRTIPQANAKLLLFHVQEVTKVACQQVRYPSLKHAQLVGSSADLSSLVSRRYRSE